MNQTGTNAYINNPTHMSKQYEKFSKYNEMPKKITINADNDKKNDGKNTKVNG